MDNYNICNGFDNRCSIMNDRILSLHEKYNNNTSKNASLREVYSKYIKKKESAFLEAVASVVSVNQIFLQGQIDSDKITPQMKESFELAYPNHDFESLLEESPEKIEGFMNGWKGKYFEVLVRDKLNAGESIGDIQLESGQFAELASSPIQPGWDLQIINSNGQVEELLQLKATNSLSYLKEALEKYPDIDIITTSNFNDIALVSDDIIDSGFGNEELNESLFGTLSEIAGNSGDDLIDSLIPGIPFIIITLSEGRKVITGKKSMELALASGFERSLKSTAAIISAGIVHALNGGVLSIPVAFFTRLAIDKFQINRNTYINIDSKIKLLSHLNSKYST